MGDNTERSFIMVKPDGVHRGVVGEIIKRFEQRGYRLVAMKFVWVRDRAGCWSVRGFQLTTTQRNVTYATQRNARPAAAIRNERNDSYCHASTWLSDACRLTAVNIGCTANAKIWHLSRRPLQPPQLFSAVKCRQSTWCLE